MAINQTTATHIIEIKGMTVGLDKAARDAKVLEQQLQDFGLKSAQVSKIIGVETTRALHTVGKGSEAVSTVIEKQAISWKDAAGNINVATILMGETPKVLSNVEKSSISLSENIGRLAQRALLTIPIWFAIRQSIAGVFNVMRTGLSDIASFDAILQKLKLTLTATSTNVEGDFNRAKEAITSFSLESGVKVEEVTKAIERFTTVGFDFSTALKSGLDATKLSVVLFGDAGETADVFARSLRVATEGIDDATEKQRIIAEAMALTFRLYQDNAFELDEFTHNLQSFATTSKIANISINDTIKLLATLSTAGLEERAGRTLKTTVLRALGDFDKINKSLKLGLDPRSTSSIGFILAIVDALKKLGVEGEKVPAKLGKEIKDLFAVRSMEPLAALVALEDTLKRNMALEPDVAAMTQAYEEQLKTIHNLVNIYHNLNRESGKAFVMGLVGADDFQKSLLKVTEAQKKLIKDFRLLGAAMHGAFGWIFEGIGFEELGSIPGAVYKELINMNFEDVKTEADKNFQEILDGLSGKIDKAKLPSLIDKISKSKLPKGTADRIIAELKNQIEGKKPVNIPARLKFVGGGTDEDLSEGLLEQDDLSKLLIESELEQAKTLGASKSELLEIETILIKKLNLSEKDEETLKRILDLERSRTEEKRLQTRIGNESLQLFDIAQQYGVKTAQVLGEVLSGERDFTEFVRKGGKDVEIFQKSFPNIFKAQQAEAFFKGERVPGEVGLRGGENIPIEEEFIRTTAKEFSSGIETLLSKFESIYNDVSNKSIVSINANTQAVDTATKVITSYIEGKGYNMPPIDEDIKKKKVPIGNQIIEKSPGVYETVLSNESVQPTKNMGDLISNSFSSLVSKIFTGKPTNDNSISDIKNTLFGSQAPSINNTVNITNNINTSIADESEITTKVIDTISQEMERTGTKINNSLSNTLVGKQSLRQ